MSKIILVTFQFSVLVIRLYQDEIKLKHTKERNNIIFIVIIIVKRAFISGNNSLRASAAVASINIPCAHWN